MQQRMPDLTASGIQLVVVVDQDATAEQALTALGADSTVPLLMGTNAAYSSYQVAGVPANYLIDRNGRLVTQAAGWIGTLPSRWIKLISEIERK